MSPSSSSSSPSSLPPSALVGRLRAAGCVFAEDEARLLLSAARTPGELAAMVDRRVAGVPLEHVVGWAEFRGLRVAVDPGVFVPRRRTEFLAERAVALARRAAARRTPVRVVDLCCGSGALGAAVAAEAGPVELHAADVDPAAVHCARRNLDAADGRVYEGDLYEPLPRELRGDVDVLLANVPYVPTARIRLLPSEARDHEAPVALDGGADGLDVLRRVVAGAVRWLAPGGHLLSEIGTEQIAAATGIVTASGLTATVAGRADLEATVLIGARPARP